MNTETGGLFYQLSVDETLTSTNSTPDGISSAEDGAFTAVWVKMRYRKKQVNRHGCVFMHFNDVLIYVLLAAALADGGDNTNDTGDPAWRRLTPRLVIFRRVTPKNRSRAFATCLQRSGGGSSGES